MNIEAIKVEFRDGYLMWVDAAKVREADYVTADELLYLDKSEEKVIGCYQGMTEMDGFPPLIEVGFGFRNEDGEEFGEIIEVEADWILGHATEWELRDLGGKTVRTLL